MANIEYIHFLVTGGAVKEAYNRWKLIAAQRSSALERLCTEFGADGIYGSRHQLMGLHFPEGVNPPEGWKPIKQHSEYFFPSGAKGLNKDLRKRLKNHPQSDAQDFQEELGYSQLSFARIPQIFYIVFELFGDCFILKVPKVGLVDGNSKFVPPDHFCVEIPTSKYYQIKEEYEAKNPPVAVIGN